MPFLLERMCRDCKGLVQIRLEMSVFLALKLQRKDIIHRSKNGYTVFMLVEKFIVAKKRIKLHKNIAVSERCYF